MLPTPPFSIGYKQTLSEFLINLVIEGLQPDIDVPEAVLPWEEWLHTLFPYYVTYSFAQRHIEFWEWVECIKKGERPIPLVAIWSRGGAKSTSAELALVRIGAKRARKYVWYCCGTQEQADKHVETIASMLESSTMALHHKSMAERSISKYGYSRGWRRQRLHTRSGYTIDSIGLDTATRGAKVQEQRPDMIVMDDIDDKHDTRVTVKHKIETITNNILPAGSSDLAVLFIQNLIHPNSVASKLIGNEPPFVIDRKVSGLHPAIDKLTYEEKKDKDGQTSYIITGGKATWEGQSIAICQEQIKTWGITAFLQEAQHKVQESSGGIYNHIKFAHCTIVECPPFVNGCVWVDPAVTSTDGSNCQGLQVDAISEKSIIYRLFSWEQIASPEAALRMAILKAIEYGFHVVGVETDQGGDAWRPAYEKVCDVIREEKNLPRTYRFPEFAQQKAGQVRGSKVERSMRMLADYERGRFVHVIGTHEELESALRRFPSPPLDLADAAFWGWWYLAGGSGWSMGMGK